MKISLVIIMIFMTNICLHAQLILAQDREVFVGTFDVGETDTIIYKLTSSGDVWDKIGGTYPNHDYELTDDYNTPFYQTIGESDSPHPNNNWKGFGFCNSSITPTTLLFGYGKYIVRPKKPDGSNHSTAFFYLDFRHFLYPSGSYPNPYNPFQTAEGGNDIWISYEYSSTHGWHFNYALGWQDTFTRISNGSTKTIGGVKGIPNNALILITSEGSNPVLQWGPNSLFNGTENIKVYRATSSTPVTHPKTLDYTLIATLDAETFRYIDIDIRLNENGEYIYYYVKSTSGSSNFVETRGNVYKESPKENIHDEITLYNFNLSQNHPNPFNPSTTITYSISKRSYVNLRIYNSLAQELALLVDEMKSEGEYSVKFDASNLPSGVYFYQLVTDHFSDVKKMIVAK